MVPGGGRVVPWLRALGRQCDKLRSNVAKTSSSGDQLFPAPSSVDASSICPFSSAAGSGFFEGKREQQIGLRSSSGELLRGNSAQFCTATESNVVSPAADALPFERSTSRAATRFPGSREPKPKDDRFYRAKHNTTVAVMLKLLESATSSADVDKILNDRVAEITETRKWPWLALLEALQRGPKPYLALEVFTWKKDKFDGGDPKEYAKMISNAGRMNQLDMAVTLFKDMEAKGMKRSSVTCNALMGAYSRNELSDRAIALFKEMQESEDCKPTLVTYNTLIGMFSKTDVNEVEKYYNACREAGFYPDRVTYNSLIWGYMRANCFDKMEEAYEELKKSGCKPDPITFGALIIGFSKAGQAEKLEAAFDHMQVEGYPINSMIADVLAEFYSAERQFEKLEKIMKMATSSTTTATCTSRIFGFAIQAYAETGRMEKMEQTLEMMFTARRLFTTSKTLEAVITAFASKGDFEKLDLFLKRIKSLGWSYQQSTFHTLIFEYGKARQFEKMEDVFDELKSSRDAAPTLETYQLLGDSYDSAGDEEMLLRTVERMRAAGFSTQGITEKEVDRVWTDAEIFDGKRR